LGGSRRHSKINKKQIILKSSNRFFVFIDADFEYIRFAMTTSIMAIGSQYLASAAALMEPSQARRPKTNSQSHISEIVTKCM
jgi:hypothetical protein